MSVIKVMPWGEDQGDFVLINEEDFNADVHELYVEGVVAATRPSKGLNVEQLKAALTAKSIDIPEGAKKGDLAKLLDEAPAE